jgi:anti-sigma B factor antagonist
MLDYDQHRPSRHREPLASNTRPSTGTSTTEQPPHRSGTGATELDYMTTTDPVRFKIVIAQQGTTTTITFGGEWDLAEQHTTRQAIRTALAHPPECLVLDLSQLTFIDSSAIHVILELQNRAAQQNIRLVIAPGGRAVQRPFEVLGLTATLPFRAAAW